MAMKWNSLTFGNVNSLDYGIYITGEAVYNAPERAVERVSVPGRNGDIIIDQGHWNNIEVTYPCGTFAESATEFSKKIASFRNAIVSQLGYQRLSDSYNDNEYRMGDASSGFEVSPVLNRAGEFELTFNCKPQRWLMSGEAAVAVSDGESLVNPTPYDAHPLLAIEGYGTVGFNGYEIEIEDNTLGEVELVSASKMRWAENLYTFPIDTSLYNTSDVMTIKSGTINWRVDIANLAGDTQWVERIINVNLTEQSRTSTTFTQDSSGVYFTTSFSEQAFIPGLNETPASYIVEATAYVEYTNLTDNTTGMFKIDIIAELLPLWLSYSIQFYFFSDIDTSSTGVPIDHLAVSTPLVRGNGITVNSTKTAFGNPTYVDCELGEAYMYKDDSLISLNKYIALGSDLPCLASGSNEITLDNTITELKVTPKYWIL